MTFFYFALIKIQEKKIFFFVLQKYEAAQLFSNIANNIKFEHQMIILEWLILEGSCDTEDCFKWLQKI